MTARLMQIDQSVGTHLNSRQALSVYTSVIVEIGRPENKALMDQ
jgi:hypothetical protein